MWYYMKNSLLKLYAQVIFRISILLHDALLWVLWSESSIQKGHRDNGEVSRNFKLNLVRY